MAYVVLTDVPSADKYAFAATLENALLAMGWEMWDDVSASSYKVLRSNGESNNGQYIYIKLQWTGSYVALSCYTYWNNVTHTQGVAAFIVHAGFQHIYPLCMWGNKDFFYMIAHNGTTYGSACTLGRVVDMPSWAFNTTTTAGVSAGTSVVIPVENVSGFEVGARYQIFDPANGYRQMFTCTAVGLSDITADALVTVGSGAGSVVGTHPFSIFAGANWTSTVSFNHFKMAYNTAPSTTYPVDMTITATSNFYRAESIPAVGTPTRRRFYPPILVETHASGYRDIGTLDDGNGYVYICHPISATTINDGFTAANFDALYIGQLDSGTSSGSNTVTTLNDTAKTWATDEWAGKVLICTSGTESGQIRKIISNTGTQLTVTPDFAVIPISGTYAIATRAYRHVLYTYGFLFREGV